MFWNTSVEKDYTAAAGNIYLGPEERSYIRALTTFANGFDPRANPTMPVIENHPGLRAYALRGPRQYALYLVEGDSHSIPVTGAQALVTPEHSGTAVWTNPATGATLASRAIAAGRQMLTVPPFTTDIALKIS